MDVARSNGVETVVVESNGIQLQVYAAGVGPTVVLCHGFPELAYSWRHQIESLAVAGYQVLVPDMRGYGGSSVPEDVTAYDMPTLCGDLAGLLDAYGVDEAVFVGHDWGAAVAWQLALLQPLRVRAVAGLSVPYAPRPPVPPLSILRKRLGEDFYMVWFQEQGPADRALARDVRRTLTVSLAGSEIWSAEWTERASGPPSTPGFISDADLDIYIEAFERTGFTGGLNYYRNIDRNWELSEGSEMATIGQPSMFLTGSADLVREFMPAGDLDRWLTDLRLNAVIEGAGHWVQQERPQEVNHLLLEFLATIG